MNDLNKISNDIRKTVIDMAYEAQSAHTGGSLSCVDILTALYFGIMRINPKNPQDPNRDRLVFSKAHDCKTLYAVLAKSGFFDEKILRTYEKDGGLPGHSTKVVPGVEVSAGSLGHGLSIAAGMAYSAKLDGKKHKVFAVVSDGECDEGSTWEAILFAGQHKLNNLIAIVDYNKIQGFGRTEEVLNLEPFTKKWKDFNWEVLEVDGHDIEKIVGCLKKAPFTQNKPSVLIAHTVKGYKGVRKHIDQISSHYKPPTKDEYEELKEDL